MIVRSFLKWFENAPVPERIEAARVMTQTYVAGHLGSDTREDAEAALTLILDDPSMQVRRALAWELADSDSAPRHIIVTLAHDQPEVAALVLARSPLLREPDLVDCAGIGTVLTQTAIALRPSVPHAVSAVLADVAEAAALTSLLRNPGAEIGPRSFAVMIERHGADATLREALNQRDDLPAPVRQAVLRSLSTDLLAFASSWMTPQRAERAIAETREIATIALARQAEDLGALVEHLCRTGQLTPGLLLRSLLCGETGLFGAALSHLTGLNARRIAGMLAARGQGALSAACLKSGLPRTHLPAFLAAVAGCRTLAPGNMEVPRLNRAIIQRTLAACLEQDETEMRALLAMLRRYDAEAARDAARAATAQIMLAQAPVTLDAAGAPEAPVAYDFDLLAKAMEEDLDRPFTDEELRDASPIPVDLDRFASELVLADDSLPEPVDRRDQVEAVSRFAAEIDALFPHGADRLRQRIQEPLRVIETPAQQLDETYFNSWELRKSAA